MGQPTTLEIATIKPVTANDCPLLPEPARGELADGLNALVELCHGYWELASSVTASAGIQQRLDQIRQRLSMVRELMTRKKYLVGFLGPFQAGKSRTFNNVLGAYQSDPNQAPAPVGQGLATTAVVTRLRRSEGHNTLTLFFHTLDEYQKKRAFLLERTGYLPNTDDTTLHWEIPEALNHWDQQPRLRTDSTGNPVHVRRRDMEYLAFMIKSYRQYSNRITSSGQTERCEYKDRFHYLQHPTGQWHVQPPAITPLLKEAEIGYCTDVIPPTLEMIDLPGYDSECSVDAFITDEFLRTLQGALVFCQATQFGELVETIIAQLRRVLGNDLRGRVWLVITRCDEINISTTVGTRGETLFDEIRNYIQNKGIPLDQVLFVTNEPHRYSQRKQEDFFARTLQEALQVAQPKWPSLERAWGALDDGGGIPALRNLIATQLASKVSEAVLEHTRKTLAETAKELDRLGRQISDDVNSRILPAKIVEWRNTLLEQRKEVVSPHNISRFMDEIKKELRDEWHRCRPPLPVVEDVIRQDGNQGLYKEFQGHADAMDQAIRRHLTSSWLPQIYQTMIDNLRKKEAIAGILVLPGVCDEGVVRYFSHILDEDSSDLTWANNRIPGFMRDNPFTDIPAGADPIFSAPAYLQLFEKKIHILSRQAVILIALRLRIRIQELLDAITQYSRSSLARAGTISGEMQQLLLSLENLWNCMRRVGLLS